MKETIKERFLKYVSFDTQSDDESTTSPSTLKQFELGKYLVNELKSLGIDNAFIDEYCYVYGYLKSNINSDKTIGLIAHLDTATELTGLNVKAQIFKNYDGSILNIGNNKLLDPEVFPVLKTKIGHDLITTDGSTLLGGDDKAGISIIIELIAEIMKENINYPNIIITFTPDEEVGRGTEHFNYNYYKERNCSIAYTIDGGAINEINFENFNAASAKIKITGSSIHPGSAKNKLVNSMHIAMEFHQMLPVFDVPEKTEKYEGFNHLLSINGNVNETILNYIIRNHDLDLFKKQIELFKEITYFLNKKYPNRVNLTINESYLNMRSLILEHPLVLEYPVKAMNRLKMNPEFVPIRGGTDGAHLTFNGLYTPNLGNGDYNCHGAYEFVDLDEMNEMVNVLKEMLKIILE